MIIYCKMGVAASHVKICFKRPRSQTSSVQPSSAHKAVASASGKKRDIVATSTRLPPSSPLLAPALDDGQVVSRAQAAPLSSSAASSILAS
jgi:hypothetical protein